MSDERYTAYLCKTCGDFVWGDERRAHMLCEHHRLVEDEAQEFGEGVKVPCVVVPEPK